MTPKLLARTIAAAALLTAVLISGCKNVEVTPIKTLLDDPARFDHQVVRIHGTVTKAIGVLGYGAYEVDDGTGHIPVATKSGGAPREGADVGVEGEFRSAFTLGATTAAAILEQSRYTPKR
jgi:hypothetical protein